MKGEGFPGFRSHHAKAPGRAGPGNTEFSMAREHGVHAEEEGVCLRLCGAGYRAVATSLIRPYTCQMGLCRGVGGELQRR